MANKIENSLEPVENEVVAEEAVVEEVAQEETALVALHKTLKT